MRTRRTRSTAHQEQIGSNPGLAVLTEHLTNRATKADPTSSLNVAKPAKSNIIASPIPTGITAKVSSDLPAQHYLLKSPSPMKSKRARNMPPVQSTPLGPRRRKRPMLDIRSPRLGLQDENRRPTSSSRPTKAPRVLSPLPPSSPPSYIGASAFGSRHLHSRQFGTELDDENKENIDTDGLVVSSSLVQREDNDPFGFFSLERKLKSMREQRLLGTRRPLLSGNVASTSKGKAPARRVPLGSLSPRPMLPIIDVVPQSPADEHNIDDMYADPDSDEDKENTAPSQPIPAIAPRMPLQAIVPSSSTSDLPNPLRTPHKRRRTYSTTPLSSTSSSPSRIASPSPTKPMSPLRTARKAAPGEPARVRGSGKDQSDESPVQQIAAGSKRKRETAEAIDPMTYSRGLEKLLPRRPAKRVASNATAKGKGKGRVRATIEESEDEASETEKENVKTAARSSRGRRGAGRGRGRGRSTKPVASASRVTRSQTKGKGKAKDEAEHIDIDIDDEREKERQARIEYFRQLDEEYSIEKEDVYVI